MEESEEKRAPTEHKPIHVTKVDFLLEEQKHCEEDNDGYRASQIRIIDQQIVIDMAHGEDPKTFLPDDVKIDS